MTIQHLLRLQNARIVMFPIAQSPVPKRNMRNYGVDKRNMYCKNPQTGNFKIIFHPLPPTETLANWVPTNFVFLRGSFCTSPLQLGFLVYTRLAVLVVLAAYVSAF